MKSNLKPWLYKPDWQGKRCGAITRSGYPCRRPGNKINGRCKLHGGRSTGQEQRRALLDLLPLIPNMEIFRRLSVKKLANLLSKADICE